MHERQERKKVEATRESAHNRGYDRRWARLRKMVLSEEPLCRNHLSKGKAVPATEVDHIKSKEEGGDDSRENLQALCKECHSTKTAREGRWGRGIKSLKY